MTAFRSFRVYSRKEYAGEERRRKPRIYYPIPIKIRARGHLGERLEFETIANDFSAGGFSANAPQECQPGRKLFYIIKFSLVKGDHKEAIKIAAYGKVLRSEKRRSGSYTLVSTVERFRFL
jgi:c-di-GMP-binding flagellar brake protein YcgR